MTHAGLAVILALGLVGAVAGCAAAPPPAPPAGLAPGEGALVVVNHATRAVARVRLAPALDPAWGPDRLGVDAIAVGGERAWAVPAGRWHVRVELADGRVLDGLEPYEVPAGGRAVVLVEE